MHAVEHRNHAVQTGSHYLTILGEEALALLHVGQRAGTGRHIQLYPLDSFAVFIEGSVGGNLQQRFAGEPFPLLADVYRDHIVLLPVYRTHQLHRADNGYLMLAGAAAKKNTQLNLAHYAIPPL